VSNFYGRERELALLDGLLTQVREGGRIGRPGQAVLIRGRRRVGKSRLVEEFVERPGVPWLFFTAANRTDTAAELGLFAEAVRESNLPGRSVFDAVTPHSWDAALRLLLAALPADGPAVIVLDELPYLVAADPDFEATLQKVFDREFSRRPVLLLLIGSDLAMMEALNRYDRPFHQRGTELVVPPLSPADVATMTGLPAAEAFDAYLITGGLPLVLNQWPHGASMPDYLATAIRDPLSALSVSAERALAAEFPADALASRVLAAIGSGERTFSGIRQAAGDLQPASLNRALDLLATKRIVEAIRPLSVKPSRETRYLIAEPHLRFWLAFLASHLPEIERGRGDLVLARIQKSWTTWRGRAIEPVVREALRRLDTDAIGEGTGAIGGYWTRTNDPEIDLVGADQAPVGKRITLVGSVKWLEHKRFDQHDLARLIVHRDQLPGADATTPLLVVSRAGATEQVTAGGVRVLEPEELLAAWPS
jgi:hypothetical protein